MPVVSRVAKITVNNGTGTRTFTATANVQDTPAGQSFTLTVDQSAAGTAPPAVPDSLVFSLRVDNTTTVVYTSGNLAASTPVTGSLWMTHNALSAGTPRSGTLRIRIDVERTSGLDDWRVNSDDTTNQLLPAGWTVDARDQGWVRATTEATVTLSNVAAGGAKNLPASFGDSLYHRIVLAAQPYKSWTLNHRILEGTTTRRLTSSSSATATFDATFSGTSTTIGRVNNGFPALLGTYTGDLSVANAALTTQPWTVLTTTTDALDVDPRITVDHHLQHNDNTFATPPGTLDENPKTRLNSDLSFVGARLVNARGAGVDGIAYTETLADTGGLVTPAPVNRSDTTTTKGGEAGWSSTWATWDEALPGGAWTHTITTTSADATGLEVNAIESYTLLAPNPAYALVASGGPVNKAEHVYAGGYFQAGVSLLDTSAGRRVPIVSAAIAIIRLSDANGHAQFLAADGVTWVTITSTATDIYFHPLAETVPVGSATNPAGSNVFIKTWTPTETTSWGDHDLFVVGRAADSTGTPYGSAAKEPVVGRHNSHSRYASDIGGLLGLPGKK